jgi:hypothetical protein
VSAEHNIVEELGLRYWLIGDVGCHAIEEDEGGGGRGGDLHIFPLRFSTT